MHKPTTAATHANNGSQFNAMARFSVDNAATPIPTIPLAIPNLFPNHARNNPKTLFSAEPRLMKLTLQEHDHKDINKHIYTSKLRIKLTCNSKT